MIELQWVTLGAALLGAMILGWLLSQLANKADTKNGSSFRRQLDDMKQEHQNYQINVTEHFSRTTELIEALNDNYQKIQQHLNDGAEQFVKPEYKLDSVRAEAALEELNDAPPKENLMPRDYAPKTSDQKGTLSESFGFEEKKTTETPS